MDPTKITWMKGKQAPHQHFSPSHGTAVAHGNTVFFSYETNIYLYAISNNKWNKLPACSYKYFGLAILDDTLITIGGSDGSNITNTLLSLVPGRIFGRNWKAVLPPMPTSRIRPAAVVTRTYLIVAGGQKTMSNPCDLLTVEVLDKCTLQWSNAKHLPRPIHSLQMTLCGRKVYLLKDREFYSCSVENLLAVCDEASANGDDGSAWTKLASIPLQSGASLVTLREHVIALGGVNSTPAIDCYNEATNKWSVLGQLPNPRSSVLAAALPSGKLVVSGGHQKDNMDIGTIVVIVENKKRLSNYSSN